MEDQQVGNQMVVFNDFQLLIPNIFLYLVSSKVNPLSVFVETFTSVCRAVDDTTQFLVIHVFQQEAGTDDHT